MSATRTREPPPSIQPLRDAIEAFWRGLDAVDEAAEALSARPINPPRKRKPKAQPKDA